MDGPTPPTVETPQATKGPLRQLLSLWRTWVVLFTPFILLPIPLLYPSKEGRCGYAVLIMAIYWMTEALPMAITGLLPIVLMPWLGVVGSKQLAQNYLKDTNMLFFGGLIVALAVERWNLHKRIALRVLLLVGSKPRWLMFGFMATTAFLSMWISNTATTAMMVPIAQAVLVELEHHQTSTSNGIDNPVFPGTDGRALENSEPGPGARSDGAAVEGRPATLPVPIRASADKAITEQIRLTLVTEEDTDQNHAVHVVEKSQKTNEDEAEKERPLTKEEAAFKEMRKGLTLCVAYAANIGGTATLTGTGPNLVMKGQVDTLYGPGNGMNFSSWFIYSFPNMLLCLLFAWFWLQILFLGFRQTFFCCGRKSTEYNTDTVTTVIRNEYKKLGPFSFAEVAVLIHFIVLALLWLTREPEFIPGWGSLFSDESRSFVTDACVAISVSVSLFIFPSRRPNFLCFRSKEESSPPGPVRPLLTWEDVQTKMAWNVVIVLGGGFALAEATRASGLSDAIGQAFSIFAYLPTWVLVLILTTITATFTEVTSNVATATIFLPILAGLAESISIHPFYLIVPVTVSTSFAFMLPVATPPNAIVFAYGNMKIYDMAKAGIVMNIICLLLLSFSINTWGHAYYKLGTLPDWANSTQQMTSPGPVIDATTTWLENCTQLWGVNSGSA